MSWSPKQQKLIILAARFAGWNILQRYVVMKHCGCPINRETGYPSVKHERNTNQQFKMFMSFAEPVAKENGKPLYAPKNYGSWEAAMKDDCQRLRDRAHRIMLEAIEQVPSMYDDGLEQYVVKHVYKQDQSDTGAQFLEYEPECFLHCDAPTLVRCIECMRAFVGREFARRGITPRSFDIPRKARERARRAS